MNVLSIQSHVVYGHVGNAAATFPLQRLGLEVWPAHTVQLSTHTGYPGWRGQAFEAAHLAELMAALGAQGMLAHCDAILSGYMGNAEVGAVILDAVARVKADNPQALAFYRSQGFRTIGTAERHVRVGGRFVDEVLLERLIDAEG